MFKDALITAEQKEKSVIGAKKEQHLMKAELAYEQKRKETDAAAFDDCAIARFDLQ